MLAVTASYLARRDILDLQRGAFVRLALGCFSHSLSVLRGLTPGLLTSRLVPINCTILQHARSHRSISDTCSIVADANSVACTLTHRTMHFSVG